MLQINRRYDRITRTIRIVEDSEELDIDREAACWLATAEAAKDDRITWYFESVERVDCYTVDVIFSA